VESFQDPSLTFNMVDHIYNTVYRLYVYFGVTRKVVVIDRLLVTSIIFANKART
jgi:hypothetical protein